MALRYWVGGSGNWADTAKWSTTSGGTGGASVPTSADDAIVNSSSGSPAINLQSTDANCKTLTTTGAACSFSRSLFSSAILNVYGNITLASGTTLSVPVYMEASGTFTRAGASFGSGSGIIFNAGSGATYTIADAFSGRSITLNGGTLTLQAAITSATTITINSGSTFNTGANNVTAEELICNGSGRTLNMGSGTWTISTQWTVGSSATLNAETANIDLTNGADFSGGNKSYNRVRFTSGGIYTITGSNSFTEMSSTSTVAFTVRFTAGTTNTFDSFTVQGAEEGELATIESTSTTKANLVKPSFWFVRFENGDTSITRCTGVYFVTTGGLRFVNFTDINGQVTGQESSSFLQMFD